MFLGILRSVIGVCNASTLPVVRLVCSWRLVAGQQMFFHINNVVFYVGFIGFFELL